MAQCGVMMRPCTRPQRARCEKPRQRPGNVVHESLKQALKGRNKGEIPDLDTSCMDEEVGEGLLHGVSPFRAC